MEIALNESFSTYSGGLGILAGDTLRSAADLGVPMVAVTLAYPNGYFRQHLAADGMQAELPDTWSPAAALQAAMARVSVRIEDRDVAVAAWRYDVVGINGDIVPAYLLDTDLPENSPHDRTITATLYGGDAHYRLMQEIVLGVGGGRMLEALGYRSLDTYHMAGVVLGVASALAGGLWFVLAKMAKVPVGATYPAFAARVAEAEGLTESGKTWTKATFEATKAEVEARREQEVKKADEKAAQTVAEAERNRDQAAREADAAFPPRLQAILDRKADALKQADDVFPRRLNEIQERFNLESKKLKGEYEQRKAATEKLHSDDWNAMETRWKDALSRAGGLTDQVNAEAARLYLDWHHADLDVWNPPEVVPPGLQFARFTVDLAEIPQGIPVDPRLKTHGPTNFTLPAILPFPDKGSLLIKAADSGKAEAVKLLQAMMLRYLTSIPPGKVRFTIIDPVGLGENFAAFMHLGDYSELLINGRIWTEQSQIDQRTADLTAHMENVIQKYLRNEFESIEAYNAHAGEVAEPFRVIVAANFPVGWSENAARRLLSIASTGARCGVYTLISLDTKLAFPAGVQLKDLEPHCTNVVWREGKLLWRDGNFGRFPLALDSPPDSAMFSAIMHKVGELAKNANRVEVPFEYIAPTAANYWTSDSRAGIDVPLGRAGATKLQHLKLGKGTSQHVLIAGRTGSGKSTLLHALITNLALHYSPEEVHLYLIDFKKGVEFKDLRPP